MTYLTKERCAELQREGAARADAELDARRAAGEDLGVLDIQRAVFRHTLGVEDTEQFRCIMMLIERIQMFLYSALACPEEVRMSHPAVLSAIYSAMAQLQAAANETGQESE